MRVSFLGKLSERAKKEKREHERRKIDEGLKLKGPVTVHVLGLNLKTLTKRVNLNLVIILVNKDLIDGFVINLLYYLCLIVYYRQSNKISNSVEDEKSKGMTKFVKALKTLFVW